jgi:4'-phosphopantetheinyl transferase superfamily
MKFEMITFMSRNQIPSNSTAEAEQHLETGLQWHARDDSKTKFASFFDNGDIGLDEFALCLSADEKTVANKLSDPCEVRHFAMRRAFQRCYVKNVSDFKGPLSELPITHARDTAPHCPLMPKLSISFSSSGSIAIAASSNDAKIGIDIEIVRPIESVLELSNRFFHKTEAVQLSNLHENHQGLQFLRYWTIKEACLKAIGRGVVYGPEKFIVSSIGSAYIVDPPGEFGARDNWNIEFIELSSTVFAAIASLRLT